MILRGQMVVALIMVQDYFSVQCGKESIKHGPSLGLFCIALFGRGRLRGPHSRCATREGEVSLIEGEMSLVGGD